MPSKKAVAGMELIVAALRRNKNATYADIKASADKKGVSVYPIMFGRAKALLGLVKVAKRGQGKAAREARQARRGSATWNREARPIGRLSLAVAVPAGLGRPLPEAASMASRG